jgi:hypothetical protein
MHAYYFVKSSIEIIFNGVLIFLFLKKNWKKREQSHRCQRVQKRYSIVGKK